MGRRWVPTDPVAPPAVATGASYEQMLSSDPRWALMEGSRHFDEKSAVFDSLRRIAARLDGLGIPYAVVGGMALFRHGLRRFTEDVDLLVTREDLKTIHQKLEGLGYLPPHRNSKHLRDTETNVRIEFLTTGEYPGDGLEKPVAFPDPRAVSFRAEGVSCVNLGTLVELKLASGMTNSGRMKDLSDVMELIKTLDLKRDFADGLNPYVREKYRELWGEARKRFVTLWRNKWITSEATTIADMAATYRRLAEHFDAMMRDGVTLDPGGGTGDDYAMLVTDDPEIAKKYDFIEESEYWGEGQEQDDEGDDIDEEGPGAVEGG